MRRLVVAVGDCPEVWETEDPFGNVEGLAIIADASASAESDVVVFEACVDLVTIFPKFTMYC